MMNDMQVTSAQYITGLSGSNSSIKAVIDGQELFVPLDLANRHYAAILAAVEADTLTIQQAAPSGSEEAV